MSGEMCTSDNIEHSERTYFVADILDRQSLYILKRETPVTQDQATSNKNEGGYMKLDGEAHQSTYLLLGRHDPCSPLCTFVAPRAHCTNLMSTVRGAAQQIECETITRDTAFTDSERLFLGDELLSAESLGTTSDHCTCTSLQDYNLNGIFDSLKSASPVLATQVQNKSLELEGRSVPGDHVNALLKPAIMNRTSRFGWLGRRKVSDAHELGESMVFRRKFLLKEHSEAYPRVSPSSTVLNFDNDGVDIYGTSRGNEIDEDEFRHGQGTGQLPESYLEDVIQLHSHIITMTNLGIEIAAESGSVVQYEQQKSSEDVGGRCAFTGNDGNLHERGEEVLMKTMGWITFPVEYPNEDNDTTLSLRWILDELSSASDLPHLESLMEISPSKFWSPISEPSKRPPVQFGYLNSSASPQSSHSIQYFLNDSPASSPEMKRIRTLGGASGLRIASKESNRRCSRGCRNIQGTTQRTLTPRPVSGEPMETGMKSPSSGSDRTSSPNSFRFSSPLHQDHTHHRETGSVANLTPSDTAARRLQHSHIGKNLVMDFLEVGRTQENIEAKRITNGLPRKDTTVQSSGTQNENTSDQMRLQCLAGRSGKERESALPSLELQIVRGVDGNWFTERAYECHQNCKRKTNDPLVPLSDISNHPNLATSLRNSLHEKIESQLLYRKPLPESVEDERLVSFQCPEPTPENFACSTPAVPRVSRKRSSRITMPKLSRVDVLNLFGTGKAAQPIRTTPDIDFCPCKRRKTSRKRTEVSTSQRDVKVQSTTAGDCEIDLKEVGMQGGTSTPKLPTLTRMIKPLRLLKSSTAKGYICVPRKLSLRSTVRKRLPSDLRNVNATHSAKRAPIKHSNDESEVVAIKNPGSSGNATRRQKVKDDCLRTLPAGSEMSVGILRSSKYRGVTRHRHTGRYEAHLWDNTRVKLGLAKRGRQVYLGAYPNEDEAAQAHDLAALKYWGPHVYTNFPLSLYEEELKTMKNLTKEEYIVILRRRSPGFTRGVSKYRGVTRHHQEGRWEARIGRHSGAKYHYLGTYDTQEEAAAAYDRAAVRHRGENAITNFDISNYIKTKSKAYRNVSPSSPSGES